MKVLADHCVPDNIVRRLRSDGHIVERVVDAGDPRADDKTVAALAARLSAVLVTADRDFSRRSDFPPRRFPGIVVLKDLSIDQDRVYRRLARLLTRLDSERLAGVVAIVDRRSVHLRR
ncbi:MAG: DUF5615 family PIN-like protein [Armatimonadetes bacterium]|nr:DUF5615 family PIN-like protein [Armatimonadota bacterium]